MNKNYGDSIYRISEKTPGEKKKNPIDLQILYKQQYK